MSKPAKEVTKQVSDEFAVDKTTGEVSTTAKFVPKVLRSVTVETLKVSPGQTVYIQILKAMEKAKRAVGKAKEPATLLSVRDLETGKQVQMVLATVLHSILDEEYPNNTYVGKGFAIHKSATMKGEGADRKYFTYLVDEIEVPA